MQMQSLMNLSELCPVMITSIHHHLLPAVNEMVVLVTGTLDELFLNTKVEGKWLEIFKPYPPTTAEIEAS